jgi:hypothetical protein
MKEGNKWIWAAAGNIELMFTDAKVVENDVFYLLLRGYSH